MIEHVTKLLGSLHIPWDERADPRESEPPSSLASCRRDENSARQTTRSQDRLKPTSPSRARHRLLVIGSLLHASFFVLMGTSTGFQNVLIAYFTASLGKAFINGKYIFVSNVSAYVR